MCNINDHKNIFQRTHKTLKNEYLIFIFRPYSVPISISFFTNSEKKNCGEEKFLFQSIFSSRSFLLFRLNLQYTVWVKSPFVYKYIIFPFLFFCACVCICLEKSFFYVYKNFLFFITLIFFCYFFISFLLLFG
jgi:hypothetical protein